MASTRLPSDFVPATDEGSAAAVPPSVKQINLDATGKRKQQELAFQSEQKALALDNTVKRDRTSDEIFGDALTRVQAGTVNLLATGYGVADVVSRLTNVPGNVLESTANLIQGDGFRFQPKASLDSITGLSPAFDQLTSDIKERGLSDPAKARDAIVAERSAEFASGEEARRAANSDLPPGVATAFELGGAAATAVGAFIDQPTAAIGAAMESIPQLLTGGLVGKAAQNFVLKKMSTQEAKSYIESEVGKKAMEKLATRSGIANVAVTESMSNAVSAKGEVLGLTEQELFDESPVYAELRETMGHEQARAAISNNVFDIVAGLTSVTAGVASKISGAGKFEGSLFTGKGKIFKTITGGAGSEFVEEALQGGTGELAGNIAKKTQTNKDQKLTEGVGQAVGAGAVVGSLAGGGIASVKGAVQTAADVAKAPKKVKASIKQTVEVEKALQTGDITNLTDPKSKDFTPARAAEAMLLPGQLPTEPAKLKTHLATVNKHLNAEEARILETLKKLETKPNPKEQTKVLADLKTNEKRREQLKGLDVSTVASPKEVTESINKAAKGTDIDASLDTTFTAMGSSPGSVNLEQLATLQKSENISAASKTRIGNFIATREAAETAKTLSQTNNDVLVGSKNFTGIEQYLTNIDTSITLDDQTGAEVQQTRLESFAKTHRERRDIIKPAVDAWEAWQARKKVQFPQTPRELALIAKAEALPRGGNQKGNFRVGVGAWKVRNALVAEVAALDAAVAEVGFNISQAFPSSPNSSTTQAKEALAPTAGTVVVEETTKTKTPSVQQEATDLIARLEAVVAEDKAKVEAAKFSLPNSVLKGKVGTKAFTSISKKTKEVLEVRVDEPNVIASLFETRGKTDSTNFLGTVENFFTAFKADPSIVSDLSEAQQKALKTVAAFNADFVSDLNSLIKPRDERFGGVDRFQMLLNEDTKTLDENIASTIAMVSLNWLATRATDTRYNDEVAIRSILGRDEDSVITDEEFNYFRKLGSVRSNIIEELGRDIVSSLGIKAKADANGQEQGNLEVAVGMMAVASLVKSGAITQQERTNKEMAQFFGDKAEDDRATTTFLRMATVEEKPEGFTNVIDVPHPLIQAEIDNIKNSDDLLTSVFGIASYKTAPSFDKPRAQKERRIQGSDFQTAPSRVNDIVNAHEKRPNTIKRNIMKPLSFLGKKNILLMEGFNDDFNRNEHVVNRAGVEGKNAAILRSVESLLDFVDTMDGDLDKPFYFTHAVWKNMRLGMVSNTINPQADKLHRHVMGMQDHTTTIDPKNPQQVEQLLLAVAESVGVKVDKNFTVQSRKDLFAIMNTPVMKAGIEALGQLDNKDNKPALQKQIMAAIEAGGEKAFTLDGLVAFAAFNKARKDGTTFEANIFREVDGVTNGVIIGLLQLAAGPGETVQEQEDNIKEMLARGGVFTDSTSDMPTFTAAGNQDSYQDMTQSWARRLSFLNRLIDGKTNVPEELEESVGVFQRMDGGKRALSGISGLVGQMVDDEGVTKIGRDLSKNPLMITNYGAAIQKTVQSFAENVLLNTYTKMAENRNDQAELNKIALNLNRVLNPRVPIVLDSNNATEFTLDDTQKNLLEHLVKNSYGTTLEDAINEKFETFIAKRKETNNALRLIYEGFKLQYDNAVAAVQDANNGNDPSKEQLAKINKDLIDSMPIYSAFFSTKKEEGILVMNKDKVRKRDKKHSTETKLAEDIPSTLSNGTVKNRSSLTNFSRVTTWEDGGVSGAILGIHSADAATMMLLLEKFSALNVHDAAAFGLDQTIEGSEKLNESFLTVMKDYSMRGEINKTLQSAMRAMPADVRANLESRIRIKDTKDAQYLGFSAESIPEFVRDFNAVTNTDEAFRQKIIADITGVSQYNPGEQGQFVPPGQKPVSIADEAQASAETFGSSVLTNIDVENFNAERSIEVTGANLLEVYEDLGSVGSIQDSSNHEAHLRTVLSDIVSKVIEPFTIHMREEGTVTEGAAYRGDVFMHTAPSTPAQTYGTAMSAREVSVHEQIHIIIGNAVNGSTAAAKELRNLYENARTATDSNGNLLITAESFIGVNVNKSDTDYATHLANGTNSYEYIFGSLIQERNIDQIDPVTNTIRKASTNTAHNEFAAYAATNEAFMAALSKVPGVVTGRIKDDGSLLDKIQVFIINTIDTITGWFMGTGGLNASDKALVLIAQLAGVDRKNKSRIYNTIDSAQANVSKAVNIGIAAAVFPIRKFVESSFVKQSKSEVVRNLGGIARMIPTADMTLFFEAIGKSMGILKKSEDGFARSVANEIRGRTQDNTFLHTLLRKSNQHIDQARQKISGYVSTHLINNFLGDQPSKSERDAIGIAAIKTDLTSLIETGAYTWQQVENLFTDKRYLARELAAAEKAISSDASMAVYQNWYIAQANDLGHFMATGQSLFGYTIMNVESIASANNTGLPVVTNTAPAAALIDKLASLRAITDTQENAKKTFAEVLSREMAINPDENGITFALLNHKDIKDKAAALTFAGNTRLMIKGFTKEIVNPNISILVAPASEQETLLKEGYVMGAAVAKDPMDPSAIGDMRLFKSKNGKVSSYMAGIISYTGKRSKGTNLIDIYAQNSEVNPGLHGYVDFVTLNRRKQATIQSIVKGQAKPVAGDSNSTVPVTDGTGVTVGYRYMMAEATKNEQMEKNNSFEAILGGMAANTEDKVNTQTINNVTIQALHDDFRASFRKNPNGYTEVSATTASDKYREVWQMLPQEAKDEVKRVWGTEKMWVKNDVAVLVFGQRKWSVTNLRKSDEPNAFGHRKMMNQMNDVAAFLLNRPNVKFAENVIQETATMVKDAIVVKSGVVLVGNVASNLVALKVLGVPASFMWKFHAEALSGASAYKKDTTKLDELKREKRLVNSKMSDANITRQIKMLNNAIANNPVRELIEAGIHQSIVEDIDLIDNQFTYKGQLGDMLDNNSFAGPIIKGTPDLLKKAGQNLFMTHDSAVYKFMRDSTQVSDFAARYVLHKHNMQNVKMTSDDSINMIVDVFINYDLPTHQALQYGNDMGITLFTKFFIRIQKIIWYMAKNHPGNTVASLLGQMMFGDISDITDALATPDKIINKLNLNLVDTAMEIIESPAGTGQVFN